MPMYLRLRTCFLPGMAKIYHLSKTTNLSREARKRLKWFDWYRSHGQNVALTCRHFGISRKIFYKWKRRFNPNCLCTLESHDRAPKQRRQREINWTQEERIINLRKQYPYYGREKIAWLYLATYGEKISNWKIQKTIEKYRLYSNPKRTEKIRRKRQRALKKKRITELKKQRINGFLLCLDVIVIYWNGLKRYIFTAIDYVSKIAFARMYTSRSSYNSADFLRRLYFLLDGKILNLGHDNGSEWQKNFCQTCQKLNIQQYYSRPYTPKDNAVNERFNQTLENEFLKQGNFVSDPQKFNQKLTEWLIEYNFRRPHQSLGYIPPINFQAKYLKVLPMYPSRTVPLAGNGNENP